MTLAKTEARSWVHFNRVDIAGQGGLAAQGSKDLAKGLTVDNF